MRRLLFYILFTCFGLIARAQFHYSDSLQISLMTVDPGQEVYECFGHTAFRICDRQSGEDIIFHYGVYDFNEPNFIWHFVEGICSYKMAAAYTEDFFEDYKRRKINVTEQILWLDSLQTIKLINGLLFNYQPENRNYRYNFFFDNCATRPFDMVNRCAPVQYDTTWIQPVTLRDMLHKMTGTGCWLDFGIALSVAGRADQEASFREQMFLPSYLYQAFAHAYIDGHPLVKTKHYIHNVEATTHREVTSLDCWLSPLNVVLLLFLVGCMITLREFKQKKIGRMSKSFDTIWLLATGIAGCIIWFLNFFSQHPAVDHNLNCLWLLPTNLLFIAIIWIKKAEKVRRIYFFIIFAAVIIYIISICVSVQYCHIAFIPLIMTIALRCVSNLNKRK